jgi:hypothetical protein
VSAGQDERLRARLEVEPEPPFRRDDPGGVVPCLLAASLVPDQPAPEQVDGVRAEPDQDLSAGGEAATQPITSS